MRYLFHALSAQLFLELSGAFTGLPIYEYVSGFILLYLLRRAPRLQSLQQFLPGGF